MYKSFDNEKIKIKSVKLIKISDIKIALIIYLIKEIRF